MEVTHPIPSSLFINQTETYIYVTHPKQQVTCHKCCGTGHIAKKCRARKIEFQNRVDVNLGLLKKKTKGGSNKMQGNANSEFVATETHIDPSQNKITYACDRCEYTCGYENILD